MKYEPDQLLWRCKLSSPPRRGGWQTGTGSTLGTITRRGWVGGWVGRLVGKRVAKGARKKFWLPTVTFVQFSRQVWNILFFRGEINFPTLPQQQESSDAQTWVWLKKNFLFRGKLYILSFSHERARSLRSRLRLAQFYTHCIWITRNPHIRMSLIVGV